jgi:hypothetical protein
LFELLPFDFYRVDARRLPNDRDENVLEPFAGVVGNIDEQIGSFGGRSLKSLVERLQRAFEMPIDLLEFIVLLFSVVRSPLRLLPVKR